MQCDTCDAIDLFLQGNFQRGRHILELRAAAGDVYALTGFGLMYQNGWGVPVDYDRAMGFYQTASRKGDLLALNQIGYLFLRGLGRKADPKSAWCSFEQAAESGFERSTQHLAEMMAAGLQPVSCKPSGAKLTDAVEDEGGVSRMALEFWNGVREGMTPDQVASVLPAPYLEKYPPTAPNSDVMVAPTVLLGLPAVARVSFVGHAAKAVVFTIDLESDDADQNLRLARALGSRLDAAYGRSRQWTDQDGAVSGAWRRGDLAIQLNFGSGPDRTFSVVFTGGGALHAPSVPAIVAHRETGRGG